MKLPKQCRGGIALAGIGFEIKECATGRNFFG
jgi:hypothetical protein